MSVGQQIKRLSDTKLETRVKELVADERKTLAEFLHHLAEMDARRLHAKLGYSSLFKYCLQELKLSESAAYRRITAARLAKKFPLILDLLGAGTIHLTTLTELSAVLTEANHCELLQRASHKTKHEIAQLRVRHQPQPDVPDLVRALPGRRPCHATASHNTTLASESSDTRTASLPLLSTEAERAEERPPVPAAPQTPVRRDQIAPLSEQRIKISFSASEQLRAKVQRAKAVLWHTFPEGRLEDIFDAALTALLEQRDPGLKLAPKKPRTARQRDREQKRVRRKTRHIPQWVKDQVWQRDHGKCQFVGRNGTPCRESAALEFDHVQPWALGGRSDDPANIRLLCRAHNQLVGREVFGGRSA